MQYVSNILQNGMVLHGILSMFQIISFAIFNRIDMLTMQLLVDFLTVWELKEDMCHGSRQQRTSSHIAGVVELRDGSRAHSHRNNSWTKEQLRPCLDASKILKVYKIFHHIESLDACMER